MGIHHEHHEHLGRKRGRNRASETSANLQETNPNNTSNEKLLCTAFVSFQCFAIAQTVAAVIAGSGALLGDSMAMMVDAFTYGFNWMAERQKAQYASNLIKHYQLQSNNVVDTTTTSLSDCQSPVHILEFKLHTYHLELIPPLISVSTLMVVTFFVLKGSIQVLMLDAKRDVSEQSDPNVQLMMLFSFLNLLLDAVNVGCFASSKHALGYRTTTLGFEEEEDDEEELYNNPENIDYHETGIQKPRDFNGNTRCEIELTKHKTDTGKETQDNDVLKENDVDNRHGKKNLLCELSPHEDASVNESECSWSDDDENETSLMKPLERSIQDGIPSMRSAEQSSQSMNTPLRRAILQFVQTGEESPNLNMCSAYTHVFADTLRSLAVILASLLAQFTNAITSEVADATAALVVSFLIILSLLPLFGGMIETYRSLQHVKFLIKAERRRRDLKQNDQIDGDIDMALDGDGDTRKALIQVV